MIPVKRYGNTLSKDWITLFGKTTRAKELEKEVQALRLTPDECRLIYLVTMFLIESMIKDIT